MLDAGSLAAAAAGAARVVSLDVQVELVLALEGLRADGAAVRPLVRVRHHVVLQRVGRHEAHAAHLAHVPLVTQVAPHVHRQRTLELEALGAEVAGERALAAV